MILGSTRKAKLVERPRYYLRYDNATRITDVCLRTLQIKYADMINNQLQSFIMLGISRRSDPRIRGVLSSQCSSQGLSKRNNLFYDNTRRTFGLQSQHKPSAPNTGGSINFHQKYNSYATRGDI